MEPIEKLTRFGAASRNVLRLAAPLATVILLTGTMAIAEGRAARAQSEEDTFRDSVAPLLTRHCSECHGATAKKGRLDLSFKNVAFAGGDSGPPIVPGKAEESLLWELVESDEMPENRPPLSPREKEVLRQWIEDGAEWPEEVVVGESPDEELLASNWLRRLTVPEYIQTVREAVGVDVSTEARRILPRDLRADGFSNTAYSLGVDLEHVEAYAQLAEIIVRRMDIAAFAAEHSPCQELSKECMGEAIASIGKWLFRGPLEEHELRAFQQVSDAVAGEGGTFDEAVAYVVEAMLQSPRFLYRIERQRGDSGERQLDSYELASRLSYILWGGPPDKELVRAADAGELTDASGVERQVLRMLEDPRTAARSSQFISEWLNLEQLDYLRPNREHFPGWNAALAADMRLETLAYFDEVAWKQQRPLWDLMNAQVAFLTPRLATHYGLDPARGVSVSNAGASGAAAVVRDDAGQGERVAAGLVALYRFDDGGGALVRDTSGAGAPVDLKIEDSGSVEWTDKGLAIEEATRIATTEPPKRLIEALRKSHEVTLEAWLTPDNTEQSGPARIVTLSADTSRRNFTLGQSGDRFEVRLRTTDTSGNGEPSLSSPAKTVDTAQAHVVYTRNRSGEATIYIDGRKADTRQVKGEFSNWDEGFQLAIGNELSNDRPWKGTLHTIAIYDRAVSADDVRRNHAAGPDDGRVAGRFASRQSSTDVSGEGLQALYTFDAEGGSVVRDRSGHPDPLDLVIDNREGVHWGSDGLTVRGSTRITSDGPAKRLHKAISDTNAITLEAWITPANDSQSGPARLITLSSGISNRNFTLGQDGDKYEVRFRATRTDANGLPGIAAPSGSAVTEPTHVVYTRDPGGRARLYINGIETGNEDIGGNVSTWDDSFSLGLANESTGDRPWLGTLHRIAIYNRALTPQEVLSASRINTPLLRFDLADEPARGGLLTQGSTLTIGGDDASMVTRGLFVLKDLLYSEVGSPPPCLDTTPVPAKPGLSKREIAMGRVKSAACGGCHARFEPLAFGLEKYDGLGSFHEVDEHGNELREDGEITLPGEDEPRAYKTSAELMEVLAGSDRVRMNITRKLTQYAIGRPLVDADETALEEIHRSAATGGGTYASLIKAIVMSDLVQKTSMETE